MHTLCTLEPPYSEFYCNLNFNNCAGSDIDPKFSSALAQSVKWLCTWNVFLLPSLVSQELDLIGNLTQQSYKGLALCLVFLEVI